MPSQAGAWDTPRGTKFTAPHCNPVSLACRSIWRSLSVWFFRFGRSKKVFDEFLQVPGHVIYRRLLYNLMCGFVHLNVDARRVLVILARLN